LEKLERVSQELDKVTTAGNLFSPKTNQIFFQAEQKLLALSGLPRRPWYRHTIYAPGYYTGYGVKTLPGIREGIEQRNWKEAQDQIAIAAKALTDYSAFLEQALK
jgi:N-acetylated-alpha-linked acidic dipeptidase